MLNSPHKTGIDRMSAVTKGKGRRKKRYWIVKNTLLNHRIPNFIPKKHLGSASQIAHLHFRFSSATLLQWNPQGDERGLILWRSRSDTVLLLSLHSLFNNLSELVGSSPKSVAERTTGFWFRTDGHFGMNAGVFFVYHTAGDVRSNLPGNHCVYYRC